MPLYEKDLRNAEVIAAKTKELYAQGLIAKYDLEASNQAVVAARTKISDVHKQIENADSEVAQVLLETSEEKFKLEQKRAVSREPSCRSWTISASGFNGRSISTFAFKIVCRK